MPQPPLLVPTTPGELLDRWTILAIKRQRIEDPPKRANIEREWRQLEAIREARWGESDAGLDAQVAALQEVNECLWDVEDALREHERQGDFGPAFVELARSVYCLNDRRSELKRAINLLLEADWLEEKSYAPY